MQQVRLELDSNVRRGSHGTALLGGSPFRLVRLSAAGSGVLDQWLAGSVAPTKPGEVALHEQLIKSGLVHPVPSVGVELPSVAFVVPVFDDQLGLDRVLAALRRDFPHERIVVVDDASPNANRLADIVADHAADLIRHDVNRGPAAARNTGWRRVEDKPAVSSIRPEVIVFVDADVMPLAGALPALLRHFADPAVAAAAPRVPAEPGVGPIAAYESHDSPLDLGADPALVFPGTRISYVPSAALAVRASILEENYGFDEEMRFGEDVDLIWRLTDDQHMVRYAPEAVCHHRNRGSLVSFAKQRFSYGSSAAVLARHHRSKVAPLQMPVAVLGSTLGALFGGTKIRAAAALGTLVAGERLRHKIVDKVDNPVTEAARLTAMSHGYALQGLSTAATRTWAPLLLASRRSRRWLLLALVLPALIDWFRRRPANDPVTHIALRGLDHGAYSAGVWVGVLRNLSPAALLPKVQLPTRQHDQG